MKSNKTNVAAISVVPTAAEKLLKLALREDVRTHARAIASPPNIEGLREVRPALDAKAVADWEASLY